MIVCLLLQEIHGKVFYVISIYTQLFIHIHMISLVLLIVLHDVVGS